VVGYAGYCFAQRDIAAALSLISRLARQQTRETLVMYLRVTSLALRRVMSSAGDPDPAVGTPFAKADPSTAPWRGHMLLSESERARLEAADEALAATRASLPGRSPSDASQRRAIPT
jgi:hypothetical protein